MSTLEEQRAASREALRDYRELLRITPGATTVFCGAAKLEGHTALSFSETGQLVSKYTIRGNNGSVTSGILPIDALQQLAATTPTPAIRNAIDTLQERQNAVRANPAEANGIETIRVSPTDGYQGNTFCGEVSSITPPAGNTQVARTTVPRTSPKMTM